jgi:hypothetical protein
MYGFSSVNRRAVATALTALLAASCARPPTQEMAEAERAIRAAVEAGAADFAPAEFTAAENRWADAKALLESQDFTRAQIAALEAKMKAEEARQATDIAWICEPRQKDF